MEERNGNKTISVELLLLRPGFWNPVSEGIRLANPVLVTNYFKEKFY